MSSLTGAQQGMDGLLDVAGMSSCFPLGEKFVTASCDEIRAEVDIYDFNGAWTGDSWS